MIRPACSSDASGILKCLSLAFEPYRLDYSPAGFSDTVLDHDTIQGRFERMRVLVAESEGVVIGTIGYQLISLKEGHIRGMAVRPEAAGTGVAQALLETVERELREAGAQLISLDTTRPLRRAIAFYERNGYRPTGEVADFFGMDLLGYVKELA